MQFTRINNWISIMANITPPRAGPRMDVVESISLLIELSLKRDSGITRLGFAASNAILNKLEKILRSTVVRYMVARFRPPDWLILKRTRNSIPLATSIPTIRVLLEILSASTPAIGLTIIMGSM